ncbi:MAG: CYTH domain-containing protein [Candidatus Zambryskibacteria bacterium]|nr:CYTH domain-containing protein [Candidatus Zambryskibacteria bacterium]
MTMYEIEHRAVLTEEAYTELAEKLAREATPLGSDDKEVSYYIFPDKLLKVVRNISEKSAKISLKLTALGAGSSFQEFEVPFPEESFETMKNICESISAPDQVISGTQKRTNYEYKGVEIALKWSEDWGYHVEFEIMVNDLSEKEAADTRIRDAAKELSVPLMTEEEVAAFSVEVRAKKNGPS